jgi:hypothetical protein
VHCPTSERTIAPGRTPGQVPVPSGAAAGTGIKAHGTPPSVQLAELAGLGPGSPTAIASPGATWSVSELHPSRAMTAAVIATMVLLAGILPSYRTGRRRTAVEKARTVSGTVNAQNEIR